MLRHTVLPLLLLLSLVGCAVEDAAELADDQPQTSAPRTDAPADDVALSGELFVFAAASLTDAFGALAEELMAAHPDLEVVVNVAGSSQLARQIVEGAPAGVFASADGAQMAVVEDAGLVEGAPQVFAENRLAVVVEAGNPQQVRRLEDLIEDLVVVLAAEEVPAGRYAREVLDRAGVGVEPDSLEPDVRSVLARVALGEADAGIVYASDIVAAGEDVEGVDIPDDVNVVASYPLAVLTEAPNPEAARAFADLAVSERGRDVLVELGFAVP